MKKLALIVLSALSLVPVVRANAMDMGPMLGSLMLHSYFNIIEAIIAFYIAYKYAAGELRYPFVFIGGGAMLLALLMAVAPNLMWLGATIHALLITIGLIWFIYKFRQVREGALKIVPA